MGLEFTPEQAGILREGLEVLYANPYWRGDAFEIEAMMRHLGEYINSAQWEDE